MSFGNMENNRKRKADPEICIESEQIYTDEKKPRYLTNRFSESLNSLCLDVADQEVRGLY